MKSDRHYVRFYHDDFMRDYPEVYADDGAFSAWVRLLVLTDKMWPTCAELPRSIKARSLRLLVDSRLVEIVQPHGYRIRGYDLERTKRQDSARNAAAVRWQSDSSAEGNAEAMPSPRPSRVETESSPPPQVGRRMNGTNPRSLGTNPRTNGTNPRARKRGGIPDSVGAILARAAKAGHE